MAYKATPLNFVVGLYFGYIIFLLVTQNRLFYSDGWGGAILTGMILIGLIGFVIDFLFQFFIKKWDALITVSMLSAIAFVVFIVMVLLS